MWLSGCKQSSCFGPQKRWARSHRVDQGFIESDHAKGPHKVSRVAQFSDSVL